MSDESFAATHNQCCSSSATMWGFFALLMIGLLSGFCSSSGQPAMTTATLSAEEFGECADRVITEATRRMRGTAMLVSDSAGLQEAWASKKTGAFIQQSVGIQALLRDTQDIDRLTFESATSPLGEEALAAADSVDTSALESPNAGLEIGPDGKLSLVARTGWFVDNRAEGTIRLAMAGGRVGALLSEGSNYPIIIYHRTADNEELVRGYTSKGYESLAAHLLNTGELPLRRNSETISWKGSNYQLFGVPLLSEVRASLGYAYYVANISNEVAAQRYWVSVDRVLLMLLAVLIVGSVSVWKRKTRS